MAALKGLVCCGASLSALTLHLSNGMSQESPTAGEADKIYFQISDK